MPIPLRFSSLKSPATSGRHVMRRFVITALAVLMIAASAWLGFNISEQRGIATARAESNHRLDLFASAVDGIVKRLEPMPATIQLNQDVLALLREPADAKRVSAVNDYLRRLNAHVGSMSAFVLNDRGVVLASSRTGPEDDSSVGEDLSFRPYFLEALSGRVGRHFAIGIKSNEPGYYVSHPIHEGSRVVGVAAIKISLEPINLTWEMLGAPGLLADSNQIVIMASDPAWRYNALSEMPIERRVHLQLTRMYNNLRVSRFPVSVEFDDDENMRMLEHSLAPRRHTAGGAGTMVLSRTLDGIDWRLMLFVDMNPVREAAIGSGFMAAVAAGFVVLLMLHLAQRRRIQRQRRDAEQLLGRVNNELEAMVADRTSDLTDANERLRTEAAERELVERNLRATQSELIHAAKMAMLGQLATGITHELTQPLGAIRTLSGNAVEFQRRGDAQALSGNLKIIARLADQMGGIIQPLKGFARKSQPIPVRADVAQAVLNALFLYELPLRKQQVSVTNRCTADRLSAWCDPNRLEQVLINLIGNAIDAMGAAPIRMLTLDATTEPASGDGLRGARVRIDVLDTGPGLSQTVCERLFEPFFTTKASGKGLGLGLLISRDIVREFHGDIEAANRPEGGACFSIRLPMGPTVALSEPAAPVLHGA
ncbi:MAG: ATP-binding protein [Ideonella sp.]